MGLCLAETEAREGGGGRMGLVKTKRVTKVKTNRWMVEVRRTNYKGMNIGDNRKEQLKKR